MRPRRTILQAAQRSTLLGRRLPPAQPPPASGCRRDAAASGRFKARTALLDVSDQGTTTSEAGTGVTVKRHPGPSFDCEPSQTHSLEGGPDDLLSRPQPVEARHLDAVSNMAARTLCPFLCPTGVILRHLRAPQTA